MPPEKGGKPTFFLHLSLPATTGAEVVEAWIDGRQVRNIGAYRGISPQRSASRCRKEPSSGFRPVIIILKEKAIRLEYRIISPTLPSMKWRMVHSHPPQRSDKDVFSTKTRFAKFNGMNLI